MFHRIAIALIVSLVAPACGPTSGDPGGDPSMSGRGSAANEDGSWSVGAWSLTKTCTPYDCTSEVARCEQAASDSRMSCLRACTSYGDGSSCSGCLGYTSCSCTPRTICSFTFTNDTPRDETLFAACDANWHHAAECGGTTVPDDICAGFARAEKPEMASVYQCGAGIACGADASSCGSVDPVPDLAADVCAHATCSPYLRNALTAESGWTSDESNAALHLCAAQDSSIRYEDCALAWVHQVYGAAASSIATH